jgi:hypothetical protein
VALRTGQASLEEFFRANLSTGFPILGAALDDVLNKVFSLHCAPEYVDAYISSTAIGFRRIFVRGGKAAAILRDLDVPEEVVEMINADAVATAAQMLGIAAASIGDVIHRVVGVHLDKLRHAVRALARIAQARAALGGSPRALGGSPRALGGSPRAALDGLEADAARGLRDVLRDGTEGEAAAALAAAGPEAPAALAALEAWAEEVRGRHGKTLGRMRDNIREGQCQCCMVPFEKGDDAAYVLAGCCQIIVCEPCITCRAGAGAKAFIKRCPNCARDIRVETGLIRVGAELDLESALQDETVIGDAPLADEPAGVAGAPGDAQLDALNNPKLKALVQLARRGLQGAAAAPLDCLRDVAVPPYIDGILEGRRDAPWPADKPWRLLVFTMHAESTGLLHCALESFGIPHSVLRGTRAQKDEAVRRLREEVGLMLITEPKDCGGLNLPFVSHVVFYHRVLDRNVEAQVAARGQRLGREHNLEIVSILNEAEAEGLRTG